MWSDGNTSPSERLLETDILQTTDLTSFANQSSSSEVTSPAPMSDFVERFCKYSGKDCFEPRAIKKTGELHNYCDYHRSLANRNQRRMEARRRLRRRKERNRIQRMTAELNVTATMAIHSFEPYREAVRLEPQDVEILVALFL